uniref:AN1-type domain-containing protein n=1 Tax=viral metagenome TaxID=1070528 RepID=A0A6C0AYA9_9ZZZZ|tara:strand:- start:751 stop:1050 length:300 start_codon:yes stop_codon:yes gene_type:complete
MNNSSNIIIDMQKDNINNRLIKQDISKNILNKNPDNHTRCMVCNKKINLIGFQCKCKNFFCSKHQYPDTHNCTFDYKKYGKKIIEKENPIIISSKVNSL